MDSLMSFSPNRELSIFSDYFSWESYVWLCKRDRMIELSLVEYSILSFESIFLLIINSYFDYII